MAITKPTYVDENGNVYTMLGNIRGPAGKDGINGKSIYANTVDPWSVSGWNPAVAGDLFLNTTTGILWSAKAGAITSNVQSNWTKVGELAGKITVDSALSSTSTNPVQNKVIKGALDGKASSNHDHDSRYYTESEIDTKLNKKADSGHSHSYLMNSSGRQFNVPTGGSGGEQKTLVITDDLNAYQPAGNYASSTHKHPISDINNLQSTIDGIHTDMGLQDEAIAGKADSVHTHEISNINGLQSALNGKSNLDHNHDSVYQAKGDYATNNALKSYVTGTTFIDYTTYIEGEVNKKANASHDHDISDINGLQSALDGKSNTGHGHTISDITNLQSTIESIYSDMGLQDEAIAGKADSVHTHTKSQITDFPTIPTVNNPTITINQGGTKKGSFTLNQSGAATIDLTDNNTTYTAGTGLSLSNGAFSVKTGYTTNGKNYKVTTDNSGNLYVSVPWANDTWRPVVDNLTTTDATKSLSANQGKVLKDLVDGKASSSHNHGYLAPLASIDGGDTHTYPWRRIMSIPSTTNNWQDTIGTYYLSGNYYSAPYYLFRVEFRTNNSSAGDPGGFAISVISTNSDPNDLAIASYSVATNGVTTSYSDIFVKTNYGWPRMTLTRLCSPDTRSITYYNSYEGNGASSRTEAYTGINGSGTGYASSELHSLSAYTSLIYGQLTANVKYANNAGWAKANDVYDWAKASSKPSYTASEVGAASAPYVNEYLPYAKYGNDSHYSDVSNSFIGGVSGGPRVNGWEFLYRAQHRNGYGDGPNYIMEMVSDLTSDSSIYWRKKTGGSNFTPFREIIDSNNIGSQNVNYANSAGSARASNISMSFSNGVLTITYN